MVDPVRRKMLKVGAGAAAIAAAAPRILAEQGGARFYQRGPVRIRYEEAGSGFPLLLIAGGGLNSVMAGLPRSPFNPIEEFKGEYRCVYADSATPIQANHPVRWRLTGRGMPTPTTTSA